MSRLGTRFAKLRAENRGGLIPFLEAFDPDRDTSLAILRGLPGAGADVIELGIPFTDPMADGPIVQRAALRGLAAGATLAGTLAMVRAFRAEDDTTPVILMGYLNPIEQYGHEQFCEDATRSGVDGVIVVDLPSEEAGLLLPHALRAGLDLVRLVAPTTDEARLPLVMDGGSGFVYYVSITGITGAGRASEAELAAAMPRLRTITDLPIAIGFGIRTQEHVAMATSLADAAVVGSALIESLERSLTDERRATRSTVSHVLDHVRTLAAAIKPR